MLTKTTIKKYKHSNQWCFHYLCNKLPPKLSGLIKHLLSHSICGHGLTGSSGSGCNLGISRSAVISRLNWGRSASKLIHLAVGRIQFLAGCWTEGLSSSLAVSWRLPSVSCHVGLSIGQFTTWQLASSE